MRNENTSGNETFNVAELDCDLATVQPGNTALVVEDYEEDLLHGQKIIVDFGSNPTQSGYETPLNAGQASNGNLIRRDKYGIPVRSVSLKRLLNQLVRYDAFRELDGPIEVPGQGEFAIADLFVNFLEVNQGHINTFHGYWGRVSYADVAETALWFNSGNDYCVSACLDQRFHNDLYDRCHTDNLNVFNGSHMLVFGTLTQSERGKIYIVIDDPSNYILRLAQ